LKDTYLKRYGASPAIWKHRPPGAGERAHLNPSQTNWYMIQLPRRVKRQTWPQTGRVLWS